MWINKRTAGTQLGWAGLPAVLFLFLAPLLAEEGNAGSVELRTAIGIRGALEVEFFAEEGKFYTVLALTSDEDWITVLGPIAGQGELVKNFIREVEGGVSEYHLLVENVATMGSAPTSVVGHGYSLNYGSRVAGLKFVTEDTGIAKGADGSMRGFGYAYEKTLPDSGEVTLTFNEGPGETLVMDFAQGRIGVFTSTRAYEGRRARRTTGTFRAGDDVDAANARPPQTLEGMRFMFRDRGMWAVIEFTTDFSGSLSRQEGDTEVISYTYDISSWPEALVTVAVADSEEVHEYELVFTARNAGTFIRRILDGEILRDTDRGRFSGKGEQDEDDDGKGGGNTEGDCLAPESLTGRTLQARFGNRVVTLLLSGQGTGSVLRRLPNGHVTLQPFSYTYSKESGEEGRLTITLPTGGGDEVQVFSLNFTSRGTGECEHSVSEDGNVESTSSGSFSLSGADGGGLAGGNNKNNEEDDDE